MQYKDGDGGKQADEIHVYIQNLVKMATQKEEKDSSKDEHSEQEDGNLMDDLAEVFSFLDTDNDGFISKADLKHAINGLRADLTNEDLEDMFLEADFDGDGLIDFDEFMKIISTKLDDNN